MQYNKFLQSIKRPQRRKKFKKKEPEPSVFHPNKEINELVKVILNLKSEDPEHVEISRRLKDALVTRKPIECK